MRLLTALLLLAALPAQVVRIENLAATPFAGWKRVTVDKAPPFEAGLVALPGSDSLPVTYVVGRKVGLDTCVVDLQVRLAPGERLTLDLGASKATKWTVAPLPKNPLEWFGGIATIGGTAMHWSGLRQDGAGYSAHLHARTGPMLHTDLWVRWYPDAPAWAHGEVLVAASNPAVEDVLATVPEGFDLRFGDAIAVVSGGAGPLLAPGTRFADGQARALPVTFIWPRHVRTAADFGSAAAEASLGVSAVGVARLWPDGNPMLPPGHDARAWAGSKMTLAVQSLHSWGPAAYGPNKNSADTGAQGDQVFIGAQALECPPAAQVLYLSAIKLAARPMQRLEANGLPLRPEDHPQLRCWDGLVHWHGGVSPDRLGKPRLTTIEERNGWHGPDVEHNFHNVLVMAARLRDSPVCQRLLANWARLYRSQWTTQPNVSTSQAYAARAVGWECLMAQHLWRNLEDRALAENVRQHHIARLTLVILPAWGTRSVRDIRRDDARLGPGEWTIDWQNSVEEWFLDRSGAMFDVPAAREVALRAARVTLAEAWELVGGRWESLAQRPINGVGRDPDPGFNHFGMPLSVATVLVHEPGNERARSIWAQLVADATNEKAAAWMPAWVQ